MKPSTLYPVNQRLAVLIQGPWGSGKTSLALQFPNPGIIDCDNNLTGPTRYLQESKLASSPFMWDTVDMDDSGNTVPEPQRFARFSKIANEMIADSNIETIIIDSAFKLQQYIKADVQRQGITDSFKIWDGLLVGWRQVINRLKTCGKIFILIAHEKPEKDEVEGIIKYFIDLQGSFQNEIGRHFSDVWRTETEQDLKTGKSKYFVRTASNARLQLKTSIPLPARFEALYPVIAEAMTKGQAPIV